MEKIDLVGGKGRVQKLAGWTVIVSGESLFTVKEVNKQRDKKEQEEGSKYRVSLISFNHASLMS